ncbi:MAG: hypothetical protein ISR43_08960 [Acidimicrobiia bacterium]|nr:hypothetical protein [Actinomycetota bacterium]MBL6924358.1 hypothetical protein [Acidimicrobiia bacterium]MBL6927341.1 hypothetical protein [Acidimicrobiia bacterium]
MVKPGRFLPAVLAVVLLASACANSGEPEAWGDQADETGRGLAERNFLDSCVEANGDLSELKARSYCTCVLAKVKAAVSFEEFTKFDDFIDTHRTDVTAEMLGENFGWFAEAVEACPV